MEAFAIIRPRDRTSLRLRLRDRRALRFRCSDCFV